MTPKFKGVLTEHPFVSIYVHMEHTESFKKLREMFYMVFLGVASDQQIININEEEIQSPNNLVNKSLKSTGCIPKTK